MDRNHIRQLNPGAGAASYKRLMIMVAILLSIVFLIFLVSYATEQATAKNPETKATAVSLKHVSSDLPTEPKIKNSFVAASAPSMNMENSETQTPIKSPVSYVPPPLARDDDIRTRQLSQEEQSEREAMQASARVGGGLNGNSRSMQNTAQNPEMEGMQQLMNAAGLINAPNGTQLEQDQNQQELKKKFASTQKSNFDLDSRIQASKGDYALLAGSFMPAMMVHGISSDLPGELSAMITENVYDSVKGENLLIPQGTKVNGIYDSQVAFGQNRLMVIWTRLIFPDGKTFDLGAMGGANQDGQAGFKDKVNNHYFRTFGSAFLTAIIGSGMQLSQPKSKNGSVGNDAQETITANIAEKTGSTAQGVIGKMLNVQPTLEIDAGYRFNIKVNKDMVLGG